MSLVLTLMYEVAGSIIWVPLTDIYVDFDFNCRGRFISQEVYELGQSINSEGQKMPILIQPIKDVPKDERPGDDYQFRLVAGHRRYTAIDAWTPEDRIKCIVEKGLTKQQAYTLNFTENLQRQDLNMVEEAKALMRNWPNWQVRDIATAVGKPRRWVKARLDLLMLPEYVQKRASLLKGGLTQFEVEILAEVPPDAVEQTFQKIVTKQGKIRYTPKSKQAWRSRPRIKKEVEGLIYFLYRTHYWAGLSIKDRDFVASTLSWVIKGISSKEFMEERLAYPENSVIIDEDDKITGFQDDEGNPVDLT